MEIDTQKMRQNVAAMCSLAPNQKIMAVLKANAYGMGAVGIANGIADQVDMFGVVGTTEACALRNAGIIKPIINLGMYSPDDAEMYIEQNISPSLFTESAFRDFETRVKNKNATVEVWIKIETGLGRLGQGTAMALAAFDQARFQGRPGRCRHPYPRLRNLHRGAGGGRDLLPAGDLPQGAGRPDRGISARCQ